MKQMNGTRIVTLMAQIADEERMTKPSSRSPPPEVPPSTTATSPPLSSASTPHTSAAQYVLPVSCDQVEHQDARDESNSSEADHETLQEERLDVILQEGWSPGAEDPTIAVNCSPRSNGRKNKKTVNGLNTSLSAPGGATDSDRIPRSQQPSRGRSLPTPHLSTTYYPPPITFFHRERPIKIFDRKDCW